jgi:serine protease AprX
MDGLNLQTGALVFVRIVTRPKSESARKTLVRLLSTDSAVKRTNRDLKVLRKQAFSPKRRGGRMYGGRRPKLQVIRGQVGEQAAVKATAETLRMMTSVAKFIDILPLTEDSEVGSVPDVGPAAVATPPVGSVGILPLFRYRPHRQNTPAASSARAAYFTPPAVGRALRYKITFPTGEALNDALAQRLLRDVALISRRSVFAALATVPDSARRADELLKRLDLLTGRYAARIVDDPVYTFEGTEGDDDNSGGDDLFDAARAGPDCAPDAPTLADVLKRIEADIIPPEDRGRGVTMAVVDSGIDGSHPEFPPAKRHPANGWSERGNPWSDVSGHGTMCAAIACASPAKAGRFVGVAPGCQLVSYDGGSKVDNDYRLRNTNLIVAYERLLDTLLTGAHRQTPLVITNSWGTFPIHLRPAKWKMLTDEQKEKHKLRWESELTEHAQLMARVGEAIEAGAVVVFSAGNYHLHAGGRGAPSEYVPNSILFAKCRPDVLTVAGCDMEDRVWDYSSRGPGEPPSSVPKPDVMAPTPANGCILVGDKPRSMPDGWGTSGACPQVAGLAAILLAMRPTIDRDELRQIIRETAGPVVGAHALAQGRGVVNVRRAREELIKRYPS